MKEICNRFSDSCWSFPTFINGTPWNWAGKRCENSQSYIIINFHFLIREKNPKIIYHQIQASVEILAFTLVIDFDLFWRVILDLLSFDWAIFCVKFRPKNIMWLFKKVNNFHFLWSLCPQHGASEKRCFGLSVCQSKKVKIVKKAQIEGF